LLSTSPSWPNKYHSDTKKNESNKSKKEAHAQRKKQKYSEITIKKDNRHQHGQGMGEEVTHVQMSRWSKRIDAGSEQQ